MITAGRLVLRVVLSCLPIACPTSAFSADIDMAKAANMKAAYLRYLAVLTTWPDAPSTADRNSDPIVIGVVGSDPNGVITFLDGFIRSDQGRNEEGRPLRLVSVDTPKPGTPDEKVLAELADCDMLFISEDAWEVWTQIKPLVSGLPIVTVSEIEGFATEGGLMEYLIDVRSGRVLMVINTCVMQRAGLVLSSRLLTLSVTVLKKKCPDE